MNPDEILAAVENELIARLTAETCEECGRGKDADGVAATALAKISNDMRRIKLAEDKNKGQEDNLKQELNPLAALATAKKLPLGHPTRLELTTRLEGQAIALAEGVKSLQEEDENLDDRPEAVTT